MTRPDALFLDIDGTILRTDHSLSPRVARAIEALKEAGTLICLATGRSWEALKPLYDTLNLDGPTVCYNGAFIVEGPEGRRVFEMDMDEVVARAAVLRARERKLEMVAYRDGELLYERSGPHIDAYRLRVGFPGTEVDFDRFKTLGFTKIIFYARHADLVPVKEELERRFPAHRMSATFSEPVFLELMGGGIDKGRGLKEVCRLHRIDTRRSAAMGDGWNDAALLEAAGDAWVMGGAPADLKSRFPSNRIAPHSDLDGAAMVMEAMLRGVEPDFDALPRSGGGRSA